MNPSHTGVGSPHTHQWFDIGVSGGSKDRGGPSSSLTSTVCSAGGGVVGGGAGTADSGYFSLRHQQRRRSIPVIHERVLGGGGNVGWDRGGGATGHHRVPVTHHRTLQHHNTVPEIPVAQYVNPHQDHDLQYKQLGGGTQTPYTRSGSDSSVGTGGSGSAVSEIPVVHERAQPAPVGVASSTMSRQTGHRHPGQPQVIRIVRGGDGSVSYSTAGGGGATRTPSTPAPQQQQQQPHQVLQMIPPGATVVYGGGGGGRGGASCYVDSLPRRYTKQVVIEGSGVTDQQQHHPSGGGEQQDTYVGSSGTLYQTPGGSIIRIIDGDTNRDGEAGYSSVNRAHYRRARSMDNLDDISETVPGASYAESYSEPGNVHHVVSTQDAPSPRGTQSRGTYDVHETPFDYSAFRPVPIGAEQTMSPRVHRIHIPVSSYYKDTSSPPAPKAYVRSESSGGLLDGPAPKPYTTRSHSQDDLLSPTRVRQPLRIRITKDGAHVISGAESGEQAGFFDRNEELMRRIERQQDRAAEPEIPEDQKVKRHYIIRRQSDNNMVDDSATVSSPQQSPVHVYQRQPLHQQRTGQEQSNKSKQKSGKLIILQPSKDRNLFNDKVRFRFGTIGQFDHRRRDSIDSIPEEDTADMTQHIRSPLAEGVRVIPTASASPRTQRSQLYQKQQQAPHQQKHHQTEMGVSEHKPPSALPQRLPGDGSGATGAAGLADESLRAFYQSQVDRTAAEARASPDHPGDGSRRGSSSSQGTLNHSNSSTNSSPGGTQEIYFKNFDDFAQRLHQWLREASAANAAANPAADAARIIEGESRPPPPPPSVAQPPTSTTPTAAYDAARRKVTAAVTAAAAQSSRTPQCTPDCNYTCHHKCRQHVSLDCAAAPGGSVSGIDDASVASGASIASGSSSGSGVGGAYRRQSSRTSETSLSENTSRVKIFPSRVAFSRSDSFHDSAVNSTEPAAPRVDDGGDIIEEDAESGYHTGDSLLQHRVNAAAKNKTTPTKSAHPHPTSSPAHAASAPEPATPDAPPRPKGWAPSKSISPPGGAVRKEPSNRTLNRQELAVRIEAFNKNQHGLPMTLTEDQCGRNEDTCPCYQGFIRVYMQLTRPISMVLPSKAPSLTNLTGDALIGSTASLDRSSLEETGEITSFYLPKDTTKAIHINSETSAHEVIKILLTKFYITDNPHKFALYEKVTNSQSEVTMKRLSDTDEPLPLCLSWTAEGLNNHQFVLQDNDTEEVMWDAFSTPELETFLRILSREENEYLEQVRSKYQLLRIQMNRRLEELRAEKKVLLQAMDATDGGLNESHS